MKKSFDQYFSDTVREAVSNQAFPLPKTDHIIKR